MRIFKWSLFFYVDKESSIVPIWVFLPRLPIDLFQKDALFSIARLVGPLLRVVDATTKLCHPSVACVQIKLDILMDRLEKIWIQIGSRECFWQSIDYENIHSYCRHCWHIGHSEPLCHIHNPQLLDQHKPPPLKQVYVVPIQPDASVTPTVVPSISQPLPSATISLPVLQFLEAGPSHQVLPTTSTLNTIVVSPILYLPSLEVAGNLVIQ